MGDQNPPPPAAPPAPAPAPPAPAVQPPRPTQHPAVHREHPALTTPYLQGARTLNFGRMDSDCQTHSFIVQIEGQDTLSGVTYDTIQQMFTVDLPLNRADFIRMWKTLILKRTQDVYELERHVRSQNYVRLSRNISTPGPLSDLLYSLGQFRSAARGPIYQIEPPARAAQPPDWWNVDNAILSNWQLLAARAERVYTFREFPSPNDYDGKPLTLTRMQDIDGLRIVKAYTNEPKMSDALVRFVNDELFNDAHDVSFATCHLNMTGRMHVASMRYDYASSFITDRGY